MTTINGLTVSSPASTPSVSDVIPRPARSRRPELITLADAVDSVLLSEDINPSESRSVERAIRACQSAIAKFASYSPSGFRYYNSSALIVVNAPQSLGSVTVSDGAVTVTDGATWPTWMDFASLRVNGKQYEILGYAANTITTTAALKDGSYSDASLDHYLVRMPRDFRARGCMIDRSTTYPIIDVPAGVAKSYEEYQRWAITTASSRVFGAIAGSTKFQGELLLAIWPPYGVRTELSLYYERYPAPCSIHRLGSGTVSVSGTTATASESVFTEDHVGSAIVIGTNDSAELRKSLSSRDLVAAQRVITGYTSGTTVTIDNAVSGNPSGRTYFVSDIVDVLPGAMSEAFLSLCEYELAASSRSKMAKVRREAFQGDLMLALADDSRYKSSVDDLPDSGSFTIGNVVVRPGE